MMGHKEMLIDGDEYDALTRWRKYFDWRAGVRKKTKRKFNKRQRNETRQAMRNSKGIVMNG